MLGYTGERIPVTTTTPTTTQEPTTTVITTPQPTAPAPRVPEKPENVKAVAVSHTAINVSWSPPSITNGEILRYRIFSFEEVQKGRKFSLSLKGLKDKAEAHTFYEVLSPSFNHFHNKYLNSPSKTKSPIKDRKNI